MTEPCTPDGIAIDATMPLARVVDEILQMAAANRDKTDPATGAPTRD